jgi:hypothetical protein
MTRSLAQFTMSCRKCHYFFDVYEGDDELVVSELCPACLVRKQAVKHASICWTLVAVCGVFVFIVTKYLS